MSFRPAAAATFSGFTSHYKQLEAWRHFWGSRVVRNVDVADASFLVQPSSSLTGRRGISRANASSYSRIEAMIGLFEVSRKRTG